MIAKTSSQPPGQEQSLKGQVAIVTGASSGIGRAAAIALAGAGAAVVVNHRPKGDSDEQGAAVVAEIEAAGGTAMHFGADVSAEDQVEAMVSETVARFGALHIMVSNAGIENPAPIEKMTLDQWQQVI